ncbi:MAG: homoserine dehydrogenase [SAR86 cluster bacterium]|nr:homoserine dehydrogenase [SAR86 cluster bacterium]
MKELKIGLCGTGNVGKAFLNSVEESKKLLGFQVDTQLKIVSIGSRKGKGALHTDAVITRDIMEVAENPDVEVLVELIGGTDVAYELVKKAIKNGKHIVTANKALIAKYGNELFAESRKKNIQIGFEASVAGGTPVIKAVREGLVAHNILWFAGILNGTSNYILSYMVDSNSSFEVALKSAQDLGLAESDPALDINGTDAAQKASILASLAFQVPFDFSLVNYEGIEDITLEDLKYADELGYVIKHIAQGKLSNGKVSVCAHPMLVSKESLLSKVGKEMNALEVFAQDIGSTIYYGPGAGPVPTASAVISDLVDIGKNNLIYKKIESTKNSLVLATSEMRARYFRIEVKNEPGVIAKISSLFAANSLSIEALIQHDTKSQVQKKNNSVSVVIITHEIDDNLATKICNSLSGVKEVIEKVRVFRIH